MQVYATGVIMATSYNKNVLYATVHLPMSEHKPAKGGLLCSTEKLECIHSRLY